MEISIGKEPTSLTQNGRLELSFTWLKDLKEFKKWGQGQRGKAGEAIVKLTTRLRSVWGWGTSPS